MIFLQVILQARCSWYSVVDYVPNKDHSIMIQALCFCQSKTGPFDHRKEGHFGHSVCTLTIENRST